jgi:hypothetical protein
LLLWGIHGLYIKGNDFINDNPSTDVTKRGIAISSNSSEFKVDAYQDPQCPTCPAKPNTFKNLHYGIQVFNGLNSSAIIQINNNSFDNVYRAISLSGTSNAEVLQNDIKA